MKINKQPTYNAEILTLDIDAKAIKGIYDQFARAMHEAEFKGGYEAESVKINAIANALDKLLTELMTVRGDFYRLSM